MPPESFKDMAQRLDKQFAEGLNPDDFEPVEPELKHPADIIYSMRFPREDMDLLRRHASKRGIKVSDFVRQAVMEAIARDALEDQAPEVRLRDLAVKLGVAQASVEELAKTLKASRRDAGQ